MAHTPSPLTLGDSFVAKIQGFSLLADGWDGSRAPAPSATSIDVAGRFAKALTAGESPPSRVAPSVVGGVAVTRRVGSRKVMVEFFNDGAASALFADDATQEMHTRRVEPTAAGFTVVVKEMREYLDG